MAKLRARDREEVFRVSRERASTSPGVAEDIATIANQLRDLAHKGPWTN